MDEIEIEILETINTVSPKFFVIPSRSTRSQVPRLNETEFGDRLMLLKISGHVDIMIGEYSSS